jgi:DNA topoisomerase IB
MALLLANAGPSPATRRRTSVIAGCVRGVAELLGDTPAVTRSSYVDPRLISRYETDGQLPSVPVRPATLPVPAEAELAVAKLLGDG